VRTTVAICEPAAVGVNTMVIVQAAPSSKFVPQVLVWEKSPGLAPPSTMDVMGRGAVPVFCTVMACEVLEVPTSWFAKARESVDRFTAGARPVPFTVIFWTPNWSETATLAVRKPAAVGANVILIVQVDAAAKLTPHEFVSKKSPALKPLSVTDVIGSDTLPLFDNVTTAGVLVEPTC